MNTDVVSYSPQTYDGWLLRWRPHDDDVSSCDTVDVEALVSFCTETTRSPFVQEAVIRQFVEDIAAYEQRAVTETEWRAIRAHHVGLDQQSALYAARAASAKRMEWEWRHSVVSAEAVLMLWGSQHTEERSFYADLAKLARWQPPELQAVYRQFDHFTVMAEWVHANGISHLTRREAAARLVERVCDEELSTHRLPPFESLDASMGVWAEELAAHVFTDISTRKRLAFYVFSALARVAAYERCGMVRWRSEWLRGQRANQRAIAGASTYSKQITEILHAEVIERVKGHWAGGNGRAARAATYRLRRQILRGPWTPQMFARQTLGLQLNKRGIPK